MHDGKSERAFSLLFFPGAEDARYSMCVSVPPPTWLGDEDFTHTIIREEGIYCLFFLVASHHGGGSAYITVNGREIRGSYAHEERGAISGSAVCSIRSKALPCAFGISMSDNTEGGMLLVFKYDV